MNVGACFATSAVPVSRVALSGYGATVCSQTSPLPLRKRPSARVFMNQAPQSPEKVEKAPDEARNDGRATAGMFGIRIETNGDVIKFGFIAIAVAYAFKTGLQLAGVADLLAGQITTGVVSVASLIGWVSTYVFRVGTKGMTYAQQLRDYEAEVIKKRYEELSPEELAALRDELEEDK